MNKAPLLLVCLALLTACGTKPVQTTQIRSVEDQDPRRAAYDDFVTRRTLELQSMGGPFKKEGAARQKALEEARGRFGNVPADWTSTWEWGKGAGRAQKQAELNDQLNKMTRRKAE